MEYSILNKLPPEAFLHPINFITRYDNIPENIGKAKEQYEYGLKVFLSFNENSKKLSRLICYITY